MANLYLPAIIILESDFCSVIIIPAAIKKPRKNTGAFIKKIS